MKNSLLLLLMLLGINTFPQLNRIDKNWLVILSGFETKDEANEDSKKYNFETIIINSGEYDNLNQGWYINCLPFENRKKAEIQSSNLKARGINNYVKYSGNYKAFPEYLIDHHFIVLNNKFVILNEEIKVNSISEVLGYDRKGITYIAYASIDEKHVPDKYKYLKNKEMIVYNSLGQKKAAKINGFYAVDISNPYWGYVMRWQEENLSRIEIAGQLIGNRDLEIVAFIELDEKFEGAFCHIKSDKEFGDFVRIKNEHYEILALNEFKKIPQYEENKSHLLNLMKNEGEYWHLKNIPIKETAMTYMIGDVYYVLVKIVFGDYCLNQNYGYFYNNLSAIWNSKDRNIDLLEIVDHKNYFPIFSGNHDKRFIGLVAEIFGGYGTYFKFTEWELRKSRYISTHQCD